MNKCYEQKRETYFLFASILSPLTTRIFVAYVGAETPEDAEDVSDPDPMEGEQTPKVKAPYANPSTTHMQATTPYLSQCYFNISTLLPYNC